MNLNINILHTNKVPKVLIECSNPVISRGGSSVKKGPKYAFFKFNEQGDYQLDVESIKLEITKLLEKGNSCEESTSIILKKIKKSIWSITQRVTIYDKIKTYKIGSYNLKIVVRGNETNPRVQSKPQEKRGKKYKEVNQKVNNLTLNNQFILAGDLDICTAEDFALRMFENTLSYRYFIKNDKDEIAINNCQIESDLKKNITKMKDIQKAIDIVLQDIDEEINRIYSQKDFGYSISVKLI